MKKKILAKIQELLSSNVLQHLIIVASITLGIKFIGFYKEVVVAANFGISEVLDTFYIANLIPAFINTVFIGAFRSVFIPNYIAESKSGGGIRSFQTVGFVVTLAISLFFLIIAYLFTDVYLETLFDGHTAEYYNLIKGQFRYLAPCIIIWGFASLLTGLLNINKEFKYSALTTIFIPVALIFLLVVYNPFGENVLAIGTLIGSLLNLTFLFLVAINKKVLKLGRPDFKNANVGVMVMQVPAKVASGFLTGLISVTDQYFAAQLLVGSIAALKYGLKIPAFFNAIIAVAISNVLLPYFSKLFIESKQRAFDNLERILKWLFLGCLAVTVVGVFFSDVIVQLLFERKEFTAGNTALVSQIQQIFLVYLPFKTTGLVIVFFLTSINKNAFLAYVSFGSVILNFVLDFVLIQYYGLFGIAISTTCVEIIRTGVQYMYCMKQKRINLEV